MIGNSKCSIDSTITKCARNDIGLVRSVSQTCRYLLYPPVGELFEKAPGTSIFSFLVTHIANSIGIFTTLRR